MTKETTKTKLVVSQLEPIRQQSKSHEGYWKSRIRKRRFKSASGKMMEAADWSIQIGHGGIQRWVNLETPSRDTAARKARDTWMKLRVGGWDAVKAKPQPKKTSPTLGEYLAALRAECPESSATIETYAAKTRTLISQVFGIRAPSPTPAPGTEAHRKHLSRIESVRLHRLTPERIDRFITRRMREAERKGNVALDNARVTLNSYARAAKSLFAHKMAGRVRSLVLPSPLPFSETRPPPVRVKRYRSTITLEILFNHALRELDNLTEDRAFELLLTQRSRKPTKRDCQREIKRRQDAFTALLLALFAGLRRDEIDTLTKDRVNLDKAAICIQTDEHGRVKTHASDRDVPIDEGLVNYLRRIVSETSGPFVIASIGHARPSEHRYHHYRLSSVFSFLCKWLRGHGIETHNPIHTLRKEFGSAVNARYGLHAASLALGHSGIQITSAIYVAPKERSVIPLPTRPEDNTPLGLRVVV